MLNDDILEKIKNRGRVIEKAKPHDEELGPFALLPGRWSNLPNLPGRGWNMIALPFAAKQAPPFRLLLNQYNETLDFNIIDKGVPNRGIQFRGNTVLEADQFVAALQYIQSITQIAADDRPQSGQAGKPGLPIHHEPGLFLHMTNEVTNGLDIARLGTIPHGNAVLGLGTHSVDPGAPTIPEIRGLPTGVSDDLDNSPYLAPYKFFHDNLFEGLFDPTEPTALLTAANRGVDIERTTTFSFDTTLETAGIVNIPFIVKQAEAVSMKATFWLQELANGTLRLQYAQVVMLDFFDRTDGLPGRIGWPHISINTLEKLPDEDEDRYKGKSKGKG